MDQFLCAHAIVVLQNVNHDPLHQIWPIATLTYICVAKNIAIDKKFATLL